MTINNFNETEFIQKMIVLSDTDEIFDSLKRLFDFHFKLTFPTEELCEEIRAKFYTEKKYRNKSLYKILSKKYDAAFNDFYDSNADTEEFEEESDNESDNELFDDYDDY